MSPVLKIYYKLTAKIPRQMPKTKEDLLKIKEIFIKAYGLEDSPQTWYTVFANIGSIKPNQIKIKYQDLVNIAKRLEINKLLQDQKLVEYQLHTDKLSKEVSADDKREEPESSPNQMHEGTPNI